CSLLPLVAVGNIPHTVNRHIVPFHRRNLVATLCSEKQQLHHVAECTFGLAPYKSDFIVRENAGASPLFGARPTHAAHDWRVVVVISSGVPIEDAAYDGKHLVSRDRTGVVFYIVEKLGHVAASNRGENPSAPCWQNVVIEIAAHPFRGEKA